MRCPPDGAASTRLVSSSMRQRDATLYRDAATSRSLEMADRRRRRAPAAATESLRSSNASRDSGRGGFGAARAAESVTMQIISRVRI